MIMFSSQNLLKCFAEFVTTYTKVCVYAHKGFLYAFTFMLLLNLYGFFLAQIYNAFCIPVKSKL